MRTPYLILQGLVHAGLLGWLAHGLAKECFRSPFLRFFAAILLVWLNLIHTAQAASLGGWLGSPTAYLAFSVLVFGVYRVVFRFPAAGDEGEEGEWRRVVEGLRGWRWTGVHLGLAGAAAVGALLIAVAVLANNWDTLAYRFPRAYFYATTGALLHPGGGLDPRLLYYPYNGPALYLFLVLYEVAGVSWNLVSYGFWALTGVGTFYLTYRLGGTPRAALVAGLGGLTTPIVLCLANSGNDELMAGLPMLLGWIFVTAWAQTGRAAALAFGVLGLAVSVGVKLHLVFMGPLFLGIAGLAWMMRRAETKALLAGVVRGPAGRLAAVGVLAVAAGLGFVATNLISAGQWSEPVYTRTLTNVPPHLGAAAQTMKLYGAQLLLAPLPDHFRALGEERAARAYATANEVAGRWVFGEVKNGPPYTSPYYSFRGLTPPDAMEFYEQTLWLGVAPWALLAALGWWVARRRGAGFGTLCVLLALPGWHFGFSLVHRYVETAGAYYAFIAGVAVAGLGLAWHHTAGERGWGARTVRALVVVTLASNVWMAGTALWLSPKRNVRMAFTATDGETPVSQTSAGVRSLVARARRVHLSYTHWELLYWSFMRLNPGARYSTGRVPEDAPPDLYVYSHQVRSGWEQDTPVLAAGAGSLRRAGTISSGEDVVFCYGVVCDAECAGCEENVLLPLRVEKEGEAVKIRVEREAGLLRDAGARVRMSLAAPGRTPEELAGWRLLKEVTGMETKARAEGWHSLVVEVAAGEGGCRVSRTVVPLDRSGGFAPGPAPEWAGAGGMPPGCEAGAARQP